MFQAAALPEYATAKIAVWWDMNDACHVPDGYDPRWVRPSIEEELKKLGYSGPVSITAYVDLNRSRNRHLLRGLSSTGIDVTHTRKESTCSDMYSDMLTWRAQNPPPATMMLISDHMEDVFSWDLARLQQEATYNFFLSYSGSVFYDSEVLTSAFWSWKELLGNNNNKDKEIIAGELSAMCYCKSCSFKVPSLEKFLKHLSSESHALREVLSIPQRELDPVTRMWGKNYAAKPEYATAKIEVWWDMMDCPVPEGYDARRVRPSIEGEFKKLGYSGPVSITAYDDLTKTPDHVLQGLSSTGVNVAHLKPEIQNRLMFDDIGCWQLDNPPPATMMLISNHVENAFSRNIGGLQQMEKYNLFLGYSFRPYKMSVLVTSAEWLWESLLAVSKSKGFHSCSVLQKCTGMGESTGMFYCKMCDFDCNRLDNFRKHLSSEEHALREGNIMEVIETNEENLNCVEEVRTKFLKRRFFGRAFGMGFHHFHNGLRTRRIARCRARCRARRRAQKSQTYKKECGEIVTEVTTRGNHLLDTSVATQRRPYEEGI